MGRGSATATIQNARSDLRSNSKSSASANKTASRRRAPKRSVKVAPKKINNALIIEAPSDSSPREAARAQYEHILDRLQDAVAPVLYHEAAEFHDRDRQSITGAYWEEVIGNALKDAFPGRVFDHYEFLNAVLENHPEATSSDERRSLLGNPAEALLLSRKERVMNTWDSVKNRFTRNNNDTADWVISDKRPIIIDVKSTNLTKVNKRTGKPSKANGMSINKMRDLAKTICQGEDIAPPEVWYIGVDWIPTDGGAVCAAIHIKSLFKTMPEDLTLNLDASSVQFNVSSLRQTFVADPAKWATRFLSCYRSANLAQQRKLMDARRAVSPTQLAKATIKNTNKYVPVIKSGKS